jgi:hypothetical protein
MSRVAQKLLKNKILSVITRILGYVLSTKVVEYQTQVVRFDERN